MGERARSAPGPSARAAASGDPAVGRWAGPFLAMFEALGMGPRWSRGRRDARAGHVRALTISSSLVVAQVRGPDEAAGHRARIAVRAFGAAEWARVEDELAGQARYLADLLAGRVPDDLDAAFARAGLDLLPASIGEVAMDCSCEHWPMPCRHLAAACYALASSFETDPFGALAWRGRGRDELLTRLHELRATRAAPAEQGGAGSAAETAADPAGLGDVAAFWEYAAPAGPPPARLWAPAARRPDALLDQLGPTPVGPAGTPLAELLRPAYRAFGADPDPG